MSCSRKKYKENSILIIILISLGIFYSLLEDKAFLLKNKGEVYEFQEFDLNFVGFDQESFLKWKEQNLKADKNEDGISDAFEARLKDSTEVRFFNEKSSEHEIKSDKRVITNEIFKSQYQTPEQIPLDNVPIIVHFPEGDHSSISLLFEELGGSIKSTYKVAINGFAGRISQNALNEFSDSLRQHNIPFFIEEDRIYQAQLYYAGRNMNLRPYVWNNLSYDGDQYSSIAIIDTGVDDSHNFFSPGYPGKIVGWRDEVNFLSSPYDDNGHGSHTSGIASGIGTPSYDASGRSVTTAAYQFDYTGYIVSPGLYLYNWTRFNVTDPGLIELFCEFDDYTPGSDDVDLWVYLYYGNTMVDSYEIGSDSWSQTLSYTATSGSLGAYSYRIIMSLIDNTGDGYVSNFKIRFRSEIHWPFDPPQFGSGDPWKGVAPDANLVGVKVLDQFGSGYTSDIVSGINWVITNKIVYNITAMSLSLGGSSGDVAMINAVNSAVENGIVTVVSAGNSGPGGNLIGSPGDADNVITVAAMSINDQITDYSSQGGPSYTGNIVKPDITAPGGSFNNLQMFSTDSNNNDASGAYTIDGYANDLDGMQGTSMSAPAVAGASNLLIEAMGGHQSWGYTATEAKRVKALLLMSATETYPLLRETFSTAYSPVLNRGGKDIHEGYGRLNVDVAIEAYTQELTLGSQFNAWITSSLNNPFNKHGLGSYANLISGQNYLFTLDVPSGADFDLHLYSDNPSSIGEPIMVDSSTSTGLGTDEVISYTATGTGKYFLIAKAILGEGNAIISYPIMDHDLSVSLEVPSSPDVGSTYVVNATVTNIGINVESNVDLFLYLDGALINSTTVSTLPVGTNKTINYMWSPTVFTTYNFTTYTPPIPSESIIANNLATELITISIVSTLRNYTLVPGYTYTWIDASGGTELLLSDDGYDAISLPFDFTFYNDTFSTVYVSSNGWLSFVNPAPSQYSNIQFPTGSSAYHYMIAPFWDDLRPASGGGSGNIYVQSFGTYWVVEWTNIWHFSSGPTVGSFEVVLNNTGEIIFNYDYISYTGGGYTTGLNLGVDMQYHNSYQGLTGVTDDFAIQFTSVLVTPSLTITSPDSTSSLETGTSQYINWTSTGTISNVKIELYKDGVLNSEIVASTPNSGSYSWTIPLGLINSTQYQIKIADVSNPATNNFSNYFEIFTPLVIETITVTNPDSLTVWGTDTSQYINWTSIGSITNVKIELYKDGILDSEIVVITPNGGSYLWTIPSGLTNSTQYQIKIADVANPATNNFSNYFAIFTPLVIDTIIVTNPESLTVWETDTSQYINWTSTGSIINVKIELYKNGIFVIEIITSRPNNGYYLWTIPTSLTDSPQYQIKIADVANPATDDFSNYFAIFTPLVIDTITVTNPDSLTVWETGTTHSITWTSTGNINSVRIELYKGGIFGSEIVVSTINDGSYDWTIPTDLGDGIDYYIRISDVSNLFTYDESPYFALTSIPLDDERPEIPGYNVYLIIGTVCMVSIILLKRRFKKSIKF